MLYWYKAIDVHGNIKRSTKRWCAKIIKRTISCNLGGKSNDARCRNARMLKKGGYYSITTVSQFPNCTYESIKCHCHQLIIKRRKYTSSSWNHLFERVERDNFIVLRHSVQWNAYSSHWSRSLWQTDKICTEHNTRKMARNLGINLDDIWYSSLYNFATNKRLSECSEMNMRVKFIFIAHPFICCLCK